MQSACDRCRGAPLSFPPTASCSFKFFYFYGEGGLPSVNSFPTPPSQTHSYEEGGARRVASFHLCPLHSIQPVRAQSILCKLLGGGGGRAGHLLPAHQCTKFPTSLLLPGGQRGKRTYSPCMVTTVAERSHLG